MQLADKKRKENIAEYIVFIYQTEDLIRSKKFNKNNLKKYVADHFDASEHKNVTDWYQNIADKMQEESIEEEGHLQMVKDLLKQLHSLHENLLKVDQQYRVLYSKSAIHINKRMEQSQGMIKEPVQACLKGVYEFKQMKASGQPLDESAVTAVNAFNDLLSYLSFKFREAKA